MCWLVHVGCLWSRLLGVGNSCVCVSECVCVCVIFRELCTLFFLKPTYNTHTHLEQLLNTVHRWPAAHGSPHTLDSCCLFEMTDTKSRGGGGVAVHFRPDTKSGRGWGCCTLQA